ncbi:MAG: hypothetical protein PF570_02440 [Candidatus Cloacimonetes bacterium]|jgi:hypothetical protein|nr:hypothetical protein [Candidatus Cloacimonadota bacterium]
MKFIIVAIIVLFSFSLFAEDSLRVQTKEQLKLLERERIRTQERIHQDDTVKSEEDVFIDADGDGIADDRNFQERHRNWRRNRQLSGKIFRQGSNHEWNKDQGNSGPSNGQGSGNGGGNRG